MSEKKEPNSIDMDAFGLKRVFQESLAALETRKNALLAGKEPPESPAGHPPGGFLDRQHVFFGHLYQFDLGEGKRLFLIGSSPAEAFCDTWSTDEELAAFKTPPVVDEREAVHMLQFSVSDTMETAGAIVLADGKYGVLLREAIFGMGRCRVGASAEPCVFDDVSIPNRTFLDQFGESFGFLPVCKNGKWTVLLLAERTADKKMFSELAGSFAFDSPDDASAWAMENKDSFPLGEVVSTPTDTQNASPNDEPDDFVFEETDGKEKPVWHPFPGIDVDDGEPWSLEEIAQLPPPGEINLDECAPFVRLPERLIEDLQRHLPVGWIVRKVDDGSLFFSKKSPRS